jgi:DNA primase
MQFAKIDFIARAPDGKEVEELARKEIVMALRKKVPAEDFLAQENREEQPSFEERPFRERPTRGYGSRPRSFSPRGRRPMGTRGRFDRGPSRFGSRRPSTGRGFGRPSYRERSYSRPTRGFEQAMPEESGMPMQETQQFVSQEERQAFAPIMQQLQGSLKAKLFDTSMKEVAETDVRDLVTKISAIDNVSSVVFDGIITKRLVEEAAKKGVKTIVGIKKGKIEAIENAPKTIVIQ